MAARGDSGHADNLGRPHVTVDPLVMSGAPCISWRFPAAQVAECVWAGWDVATFAREHPGILTRGHVIVACWFMVQWHPRVWRKRWGTWSQQVIPLVWEELAAGVELYSTVPLPPSDGHA